MAEAGRIPVDNPATHLELTMLHEAMILEYSGRYLALIEKYAFDDRNFVRKSVNWALRNIGKRNARLLPAAVDCAKRLQTQDSKAARWIAADALREFRAKFRV